MIILCTINRFLFKMLYCIYDFLLSCVIGQSFAYIVVIKPKTCKITVLFNFQNLLLGSLLRSPSHTSLCIQVFLTFAELVFIYIHLYVYMSFNLLLCMQELLLFIHDSVSFAKCMQSSNYHQNPVTE